MSQVRDLNSSMHTKLLERSDQRRRKARAKVARQNTSNSRPAPPIKAQREKATNNLNEATRARFKSKFNYGLKNKNSFQYRDNKFSEVIGQHNREMLNELNQDQERRADNTYVRNRAHEEEFYENQETHLSKNGERIELLENTLDQIKEYQLQQEEANHEAKLTLQKERARLHQDYEYLADETRAEYEARLALANESNNRILNDLEETTDLEIEDLKVTHEIEIDEIKEEANNEIKHVEQKYLNFLAQQDAEHRREIDELTFKYENERNLASNDHEKDLQNLEDTQKARIHHIQKMADLRVQEAITDRKNDRKTLINAYNHELEQQGEKHQQKVQVVKDSYDRKIADMEKDFAQRRSNQNTMDREAINKAYKQGQEGYLQRGLNSKISQAKQKEYDKKLADEKAEAKRIQYEQNQELQKQKTLIAEQNQKIKEQAKAAEQLKIERQNALKAAEVAREQKLQLEQQKQQLNQQQEVLVNSQV